jgi:PAS domain S-box-containing protein
MSPSHAPPGSPPAVAATALSCDLSRETDDAAAKLPLCDAGRAAGDGSELGDSESRLHAMCDNAYAGLALLDRALRCVQINRRLAEIDGLPVEAHLGRTLRDFIPLLADTLEPSLRHVLETGEPVLDQEVSGETLAAPGVRRHWLVSFQPVRNAAGLVVGISAAVLEITLRKHAEAALEERRKRLRLFIDRAPAAIAMLDTDLRYLAASRRYLTDFRLDGLAPEDLVGRRHDDVFPHSPAHWRDVSRVLAGEAISAAEDAFPRPDGRMDWVRWEATPWRRDDGAVGGILLFCELITERREAEEALRKAEARVRLALEASSIGNYDWDLRTNTLRWEPRVRSLWDLKPGAQASIETFFASIHPEDLAGLQQAIARARDPAGDGVFEAEYRVVSKTDQSERWVAAQGKVTFENGQAVRLIGIAINITERKRTEAELRAMAADLERRVREAVAACEAALARAAHAERIQALGKLAGGIAHDFNNALQAILGGVSLIEGRADDPAAVRNLSRVVLDAAERGHAVTRRLLAFGRRGDLRTEALDPVTLLAGMPGLLTHALGPGITLTVSAAPDLPPLRADRAQLETVLINLAVNARDAMPAGGTLTFGAEAETIAADSGHLVVASGPAPAGPRRASPVRPFPVRLVPGRYVRVTVADTGSGMNAATLARAIEPFFTTKPVEQGTGLGLSLANGFAEQSGGALAIESTPGRGTIISLWLPQADVNADASRHPPAASAATAGRPLPDAPRVLVVDDEAAVRHMLATQLQATGYAAVAAADGADALTLLDAGEAVDVLITDLSMPGMDGLAVIRAAQQRRPGLPAVLLTGGFAADGAELTLDEAASGPVILLRKPILSTELAERVAALLTRGDAAP